jgi:hypothetical protein
LLTLLNAVGTNITTIAWIRHEAISDHASFESSAKIMVCLYSSATYDLADFENRVDKPQHVTLILYLHAVVFNFQ